jgi:hypothetical protein
MMHTLQSLTSIGTTAALIWLTACSGSDSPTGPSADVSSAPPARAFGIWNPGATECGKEIHDRFATVGPDGKKYPTWHPPVDPVSGCSFGHEHGRDPRGSKLYGATGDLAFGYANEMLDAGTTGITRHEDHVGHKVEWENDVPLRVGGAAGTLFDVRCDVLMKLHQGTHSADAFTNNLHELNYHVRCSDRTELHLTLLTAIGKAGHFTSTCGGEIQAGTATPANSPNGGGQRVIPEWSCVERRVLVREGQQSDYGVLHESWQTSTGIRTRDGKTLASFDPYFQVFRPSRFFDATSPNKVGRPIDICYVVTADGRRARGGECDQSTRGWTQLGLGFDNPSSRFNGVRRQVDINSNRIDNGGGPTTWYTDALGRNGQTSPFPGSVKQYIAAVNNNYGVSVSGPTMGSDRSYGGTGTRAPN